jgi:hypothetical protein
VARFSVEERPAPTTRTLRRARCTVIVAVMFALTASGVVADVAVGAAAAPTVEPSWTAVSPTGRSGGAMVTDPVTGNVVLFGGGAQDYPLADTWIWDGTVEAWSQPAPTQSPPGRLWATMAADPATGHIVLFGGTQWEMGDRLDDTWVWDGTSGTWTEQLGLKDVPPRRTAATSAPGPNGTVVMFGGYGGDGGGRFLDDTWVWDGTSGTWTEQLDLGDVPLARTGAGMASDPATGNVILFGGRTASEDPYVNTYLDDTWIWDGTSWTEQDGLGSTPPVRAFPAMTADPTAGNVVLFGGMVASGAPLDDTWTWDGAVGAWAERSPNDKPPPGFGGRMASATPARNVVLLRDAVIDTWTWDGTAHNWTQHGSPSSPLSSAVAMAANPSSGEVVLYGVGGLWIWNSATMTWAEAEAEEPAPLPLGLRGPLMAHDPATGHFVLFGFREVNPFGNVLLWMAETWTWDGHVWTKRVPPSSPGGREEAVIASDHGSGNVVLFGGRARNEVDLDDTWVWDGTSGTWTKQQDMEDAPSARRGAAMATDPATGRPVLFGGGHWLGFQSGTHVFEPYDDTWTWDGTTWTELHPTVAPPARWMAGMAAGPAAGGVVLFGGADAAGLMADTWTWDSGTTRWTQRSPGASPPVRTRSAMATDKATGGVILFGGSITTWATSGWRRDTWVYRTPTSVSLASSGSPSPAGAPVSFTATLTPGAGPGGTVTFRDETGPLAGCAGLAVDAGPAECTVTYTTLGSRMVLAAFSGDGVRLPTTSLPLQQIVIRRPSTIDLVVAAGSSTTYRGEQTFVATLTPSSATGAVRFTVDGSEPGAGVDLVDGEASFTVRLAAGPHSIGATYLGDALVAGSTAVPLGLDIDKASTGVVYTGPHLVLTGKSLPLSAQLTSPTAADCTGGRTVRFVVSLDGQVLTSAVATAGTSGSYSVSLPIGTDWMPGTYEVRVEADEAANCLAAATQAGETLVTIASPGDAATGGGWYQLPPPFSGASKRVNFGFTTRWDKASKSYKGNVLLVNREAWHLKGAIDTYGTTSPGRGTASGTGTLSEASCDVIDEIVTCGWVEPRAVTFTISFSDAGGTKKSVEVDAFALTNISAAGNGLPVTQQLQPLKGGDINISAR